MPKCPRVLMVEDDEGTAFRRARRLTDAGLLVTGARTVAEAIASFRAARFDIVLADIRLPDGNGYELCRVLRQQRGDVPVILISAAYTDDASQAAATFAGAADFLSEPISGKSLVAAIRAQL